MNRSKLVMFLQLLLAGRFRRGRNLNWLETGFRRNQLSVDYPILLAAYLSIHREILTLSNFIVMLEMQSVNVLIVDQIKNKLKKYLLIGRL